MAHRNIRYRLYPKTRAKAEKLDRCLGATRYVWNHFLAESRAMLKRGYKGTYHKMSKKHLHRYIAEFEGRRNVRGLDTIGLIEAVAAKSVGKRLRYNDLVSGEDGRLT